MATHERALTRRADDSFTQEQLHLIRATVARGTNEVQFKLFIETCKYYQLNPLMRQIYAMVDKDKRMIIQTSIDGFRLITERTGKYAGQLGPFWCGEDGQWVDVWLKREPPAAASVAVLRKDFQQPMWSSARFASYGKNTPIWLKMPDLMLAKCAESLALRRAFPAEMSGIYTQEEMEQAGFEPQMPITTTAVHEVQEAEYLEVPATDDHQQEEEEEDAPLAYLDTQVKRLKRRAMSLDAATNAEEWADLLKQLGIADIHGMSELTKVSHHLTGLEQQTQAAK